MTIVVAFILDAFVFCIEYRKKHKNSASKLSSGQMRGSIRRDKRGKREFMRVLSVVMS